MLKTTVACDKCGKMMVVRASRRGPFLACPGYPKCKNAKDATPDLVAQFNAMNAAAEAATDADAGQEADPGAAGAANTAPHAAAPESLPPATALKRTRKPRKPPAES